MAGTDDLRNMVMTFRVSELQMLLGFAGRNKSGRKTELQSRALELLRLKSTPVQMKIRELYKSIQQGLSSGQSPGETNTTQAQNTTSSVNNSYNTNSMMNSNQHKQRSNMMNINSSHPPPSYSQYQQQSSRNQMYSSGHTTPNSVMFHYQPQSSGPTPPISGIYPVHPDVRLKSLPFYELRGELLKPSSLMPYGSSRIQEQSFIFHLTPQQASDIAMNRDIGPGVKSDYIIQVQMRFCLLETSCEQDDFFPPGIIVKLNNKLCPLPNPIPTNKPGVEPKRPPRPVNVTPLCKLSPTVGNHISISWAAEYGRGYVVAVNLVKKLTSTELLYKLKTKGARHADYTTGLIKEKLSEDADNEIATTSLRVSLICPLGKVRMTTPCRPTTCTHLQCFDASLYLQMNERKPTWTCPVCDKSGQFDKLVIDGYFQDVLQSGRLSLDHSEIQLHQDGTWSTLAVKKETHTVVSPVQAARPTEPAVYLDCDEPEIVPVEGADSTVSPIKKAVVVDLTLSDSDDDNSPSDLHISSTTTTKPESVIKSDSSSSTVSTTGRSSVTSQSYMSPNIITLDSPSPPTTPPSVGTTYPVPTAPSTPTSTAARMYPSTIPSYNASSLPFFDLDSDSSLYQQLQYPPL